VNAYVYLLGISHRTAPVALRERLDFSSRDVGMAVSALSRRAAVEEAVLLSTCNRSEAYVATNDPIRARADVVAFLSEYHGLPSGSFLSHTFERVDGDATRHLFRVAAGLDSMIVGEPQILGQVRTAFSAASGRGTVGPLLTRLFERSFGAGKRVRTETSIGVGAVSVGYAAVQLARKILGSVEGRRTLVVGAGAIASLAARHLRSQGVGTMTVVSRTLAKAEHLAASIAGRPRPWHELRAALGEADLIISCTGAPHAVITASDMAAVTRARPANPVFLMDLAVPRDVDAPVGLIEHVFLYTVDDLRALVDENVARRTAAVARAEAIVDDETARFTAWRRSRATPMPRPPQEELGAAWRPTAREDRHPR
jgi:glutamyl-tRNA reductase